ncbi:hypothetical protein M422DRAFT_27700 [Sphaerobolus stellatus SS14]|nr:hypothetical protein M422DRAFT_27700 [Sphaerobolus stellatus SS14]
MGLQPINDAPTLPTPETIPTAIPASPGVDIWRKPPSTVVSNAPCYIETFPAKSFLRARVSIKANWQRLYDQGGLVLFIPGWPTQEVWLKAGIEFTGGQPWVSTVIGREGGDWSLFPAPGGAREEVTVEIEREEDGKGTSLWVYLVEGDKRTPIRESTWVFKEEYLKGDISVGIYAARPTKLGEEDKEVLDVSFASLEITKQSPDY